MKGIYFIEKGPALLTQIGMTKSEFALKMGIQRHNVNSLFKNHDLDIIARAANVIGIPLAMLVGYVEEPELADFENRYEVLPENVPCGDSAEDRRERNRLIRQFYHHWMSNNKEKRIFNKSLNDYIYIKYISINETAGHASLRYLSTLAVLQLDAILPNAILKESKPANPNTKNQKGFKRMLIMEYRCPGIGLVRLTVGLKRSDDSKVQYCITAIGICSKK